MPHMPFCTASDYLRILYPDGDLPPVIQNVTLTVFDRLLAFTFCLLSEGCKYLRYLFLMPSMDSFIDPSLSRSFPSFKCETDWLMYFIRWKRSSTSSLFRLNSFPALSHSAPSTLIYTFFRNSVS